MIEGIVSFVEDNAVAIAGAVLAFLAGLALGLILRRRFSFFRRRGGAVGSAILTFLAGLASMLVIVTYTSFPAWLHQEDTDAPESQVGIAVVPAGNGSIAFASTANGNADIYVVDPAGGDDATRLTEDAADDTDPAWSPDGETIAFTSRRDGDAEIFVMNADGSAQTKLTDSPADDTEPAWSPDGERIAFTSRRDGDAAIYAMDADGRRVERITQSRQPDTHATWSPDGGTLAFQRGVGTRSDVYVIDLRTRRTAKIVDRDLPVAHPVWAPDGSEVAFESPQPDDLEIYRHVVLDPVRVAVRQRTKNSIDEARPAWSPDGLELAFVRTDEDGNRALYAMTHTGRNQEPARRLTDLPVHDSRVSWQPQPRSELALPSADDLAVVYAPVVYLHPDEHRRPMNASDFARRSSLACGGRVVRERVTNDDLSALGRPPLSVTARRRAGDPSLADCANGKPVLDLIEPHDRFGSRSRSPIQRLYVGTPAYVDRSTEKTRRGITYWLFYAYSVTAGQFGPHEGDWERVTVCLDEFERPTKVIYHQHGTHETRPWTWAPKLGTHPIVYSAKGSHASYPVAGRRDTTQDLADEGDVWPTWTTLENVLDQPWYGFRGHWGERGSPTGPSEASGRRGGEGCS